VGPPESRDDGAAGFSDAAGFITRVDGVTASFDGAARSFVDWKFGRSSVVRDILAAGLADLPVLSVAATGIGGRNFFASAAAAASISA